MMSQTIAYLARATSASWIDDAANGIAKGWQRYLAARRRRSTIFTLQALDDHVLSDIGLDRSEIESVIESRIGERRHRVIDFGIGHQG